MPEICFSDGVLYFPVTAFDEDDRVMGDIVEELVSEGMQHKPGGVFAACGTGEFHALDLGEYETVVKSTVAAVAGRVPVVAGTGGSLGNARAYAVAAEKNGADGLLVLPPYLVNAPQSGLVAYVRSIARSTALPLIVYNRGNAQFSEESFRRLLDEPNVVGLKDGVGDIAQAQRFVLAAEHVGRPDLLFFNGLLTAELSQAAYAGIGISMYSSAVFAMAPEIATAFYTAYRSGDRALQHAMLNDFFVPLVALRDTVPGYAVSLIKAGLRLRGAQVGSVRAPLADPGPEHLDQLRLLLSKGHELAGAR